MLLMGVTLRNFLSTTLASVPPATDGLLTRVICPSVDITLDFEPYIFKPIARAWL
jgi:hypothetical protein